MTDARDIADRLHCEGDLCSNEGSYDISILLHEGAYVVEAQEKELASLRKQLEDAEAMQDLAYYNGAKQYAVMAGESEEAAQEWLLGGCGNRQQDAIRALKGKS